MFVLYSHIEAEMTVTCRVLLIFKITNTNIFKKTWSIIYIC